MTRQMVVLVTGAGGGIGEANVRQLLERGHSVAALDINTEALRSLSERYQDKLEVISADISNPDHCKAAVESAVSRFGKLDGLIHWAAKHSTTFWSDLTADEFNRVLAVNTTGSFLITQAAARGMVKQNAGSIVLTCSSSMIAGTTGGDAGNGGPAYVSSKAAIIGLVRSLAKALGTSGVRINCVTPGVTDTPLIANYSEQNRKLQNSRVPLGRIAQPQDIASVATFLISDDAAYINGENIIVNGGASFG